MTVQMLKGKIHRATVKQAELNYVGSITVDADLLDAAGIYEYEKVAIVDIENGNRFETYTIAGERGSGMICLNGAAARCVSVGDKVILMAYAQLTPEEVKKAGYEAYFVDHTAGMYPTAASGSPWNAASMAVKGDLIADLTEDLAADGTTA